MARSYTAADRARAVGIAVASGPSAAAKTTGIPKSTLVRWLDSPEALAMREKSTQEVAAQFWAGIQLGLEHVAAGLKTDAPLRDKAIALGVMYDKWALLVGGATSRAGSEYRGVVDNLSEDQKRALADAIDAELERRELSDDPAAFLAAIGTTVSKTLAEDA